MSAVAACHTLTPVESTPIRPPAAGPPPPAGRRYWLVFGLALAALAALYFLTIPGNHVEAQDAYWYAYDTREKPYHALFHVHHLLYLPLMRALYTAGPFADAYGFMLGLDLLCGVATVGLLFLWLDRGLRLCRTASLFGAMFLAFCYGYWRYADEVEVYLPATVLQVLLASQVFRPGKAGGWGDGALAAGLATAAMLMHAPLSLPLAIVAVPLYLLVRRRWRTLAVYAVVPTVLITAAYYAAWRTEFNAHDPAMLPPAPTFREYLAGGQEAPDQGGIKLSNLPKTAVGIGADVVSSVYLFAIPAARDRLFTAFPKRYLARDAFTVHHYSRALAYLGLGMTVALLGVLGFVACARVRWNAASLGTLLGFPEGLAVVVWLGAYFLLVGLVEPENPENWVCFLLPLAALAALGVHHLYREPLGARLPFVFVGLLLAQNLVGGFFAIHDPASDLNRHRAAWIVAHARTGDVVFTRDNQVFSRYLRYYTPATVINTYTTGVEGTRAAVEQFLAAPGGARYLYVDVIDPPTYIQRRLPTLHDELAPLRDELLPVLAPTDDDAVKRLP